MDINDDENRRHNDKSFILRSLQNRTWAHFFESLFLTIILHDYSFSMAIYLCWFDDFPQNSKFSRRSVVGNSESVFYNIVCLVMWSAAFGCTCHLHSKLPLRTCLVDNDATDVADDAPWSRYSVDPFCDSSTNRASHARSDKRTTVRTLNISAQLTGRLIQTGPVYRFPRRTAGKRKHKSYVPTQRIKATNITHWRPPVIIQRQRPNSYHLLVKFSVVAVRWRVALLLDCQRRMCENKWIKWRDRYYTASHELLNWTTHLIKTFLFLLMHWFNARSSTQLRDKKTANI